jgi:hypothetical protein
VTGGWISQAGRSCWQQRAGAELAVILAAHPDLPVLAWTGTPVYLHARGNRGGVTVSVAATVFDDEERSR